MNYVIKASFVVSFLLKGSGIFKGKKFETSFSFDAKFVRSLTDLYVFTIYDPYLMCNIIQDQNWSNCYPAQIRIRQFKPNCESLVLILYNGILNSNSGAIGKNSDR